MLKPLSIFAFLFLFAAFPLHQSPQGSRLRERQQITITNPSQQVTSSTPKPRRNAGLFFNKLRAGKPVTVAYIGGSLTTGAAASNPDKTSYRALVTSWLRQRFPKVEITEINAGLPTTGSLYGTMRARRDVIAQKPDLVFVEFAASDAADEEQPVKKAVEGLLRQLLILPQPPEVVMLYAQNAKRTARIDWHDAVAAHYQVPAVNLSEKSLAALDAGKINAAALWKDGVNPTDAGHKLYAEFITAFLAEQEKSEASPITRTLPTPLVSDEMNYGEFKAFAEIKPPKGQEANWKAEPSNDHALPSALLSSDKANSQIEFYFEGTVVGVTFRSGPDTGIFECLIDGKPAPAPLGRIDAYNTSPQLSARIIGGLAPGEHRLTIRVLGEKNTKASGAHVRLGYLLVGGQRPERL
ncbi:MAG TPA: GDSL-type esterase/lipase family protein [Blastocatellia bacterium]|nr:GDSL-type esterase/lipase family protein [Blastocatellia bacterium]